MSIVPSRLCPKSLRVFLSFTPGFSPVIKDRQNHKNRFNGINISLTHHCRVREPRAGCTCQTVTESPQVVNPSLRFGRVYCRASAAFNASKR